MLTDAEMDAMERRTAARPVGVRVVGDVLRLAAEVREQRVLLREAGDALDGLFQMYPTWSNAAGSWRRAHETLARIRAALPDNTEDG